MVRHVHPLHPREIIGQVERALAVEQPRRSSMSLTGLRFSGNSAPLGGAVHTEGNALIADSTFADNEASGDGGAWSVDGNATAMNVMFDRNQAATTSALSLTPFSTLAMTGGRFSSNVSTSHDGVIHLACGTTASFSGTAIGQGADANDGAGVYDASGDLFASASLDLTCANGECAGGASNACDGGGVMHAGN